MLEPAYPLHTEHLRLRPFEARDLDDLHAFYSRLDVARFLYWEAGDREKTARALEQKRFQTKLAREGDQLTLAVELGERVIGEVTLTWRSETHQQGEIGFVFHPDFQGKGYASEAARVVLALGFSNLGLHRIFGRCDPRNAGSYRLMERLGMRREAHFIHNEWFKGEWGNEFVYALLVDEWKQRLSEGD